MRLRSDTFTNRIKTASGELVYVPPGTIFESKDEKGREKLHAGRAVLAEGDVGAAVTPLPLAPDGGVASGGGLADGSDVEAAILDLDEEVEENWTNDGKPKVEILTARLGRPVSAEERDKAWASLQG